MKEIIIILSFIYLMLKSKKMMEKTKDDLTNKRILTLHPKIQDQVFDIFNKANKLRPDVYYRLTSGYRSPQEQQELYNKGRTTGGRIVTNAKAFQSYHNYGLAFDVVPIRGGKAIWDEINLFDDFAKIAKKRGFDWGGDWQSFKDYPHFQRPFGKSTSHYFNVVKMYGTRYPNVV